MLFAVLSLGAGTATAQTTVWSATLTVKNFGDFGCNNSNPTPANGCSNTATLTEDGFTHGGVTYQITAVSFFFRASATDPWIFFFRLDKAIPQSLRTLTLHLGNRQFSFATATYSNGNTAARWNIESSYQVTVDNTLSLKLTEPAAAPPPPPPPPPVISSAQGVTYSGNAREGFSLTPLGEGGSIVYRRRTIDIPVTRDECPSPDNPAVIISRSILDRVYRTTREITFELSEVPSQDPPSGFRLEGCAVEIDPGVRLGSRETVTVCLPPTGVEGESHIHRYDGPGEWERLESQLQMVNEEELLCGETGSFSLFGVFVPVIESAQGVLHSEDPEDGFSLAPVGEGGSVIYGDRTINLSVTGNVGLSSGNPAVIVSRTILDRVEEVTFELSEVSPQDPPSGFRLEGFTAEIDLGVTLREGETVTVCLPPTGVEGESDIHRYDGPGEWERLESQLQTVNGEELLCAETGSFSLFGVFVPVIESAQGVLHSEDPEDGFSLAPVGEGGSIVYGQRTIDLSVTGDVDLSSGNPAVIVSRDILDRVDEVTFELSEVSPQDPPSGFRLEGFTAEIDPGVTLGAGETVTVCLPPTEVEGESDIHRYDGPGEWERLESRLQTVNGEELLCAKTDSLSLFGVFVPVIESAEGVSYSEDPEDGFSLTPLGEGGSVVYGDRTIDLSVTGDVGMSSGDPAVIVPRDILDRVNEITFELSEISPQPPPLGLRLEGFTVEVNLGVTLGEGETVAVCLPYAGSEGDIYYRYNDEPEEWELLESRLETVNGEELVCAETGAVSLVGVFVEETGGGCAVAAANGEGTVRWQGALFNLLLTISVLLLPGMSKLK